MAKPGFDNRRNELTFGFVFRTDPFHQPSGKNKYPRPAGFFLPHPVLILLFFAFSSGCLVLMKPFFRIKPAHYPKRNRTEQPGLPFFPACDNLLFIIGFDSLLLPEYGLYADKTDKSDKSDNPFVFRRPVGVFSI